LPDSRAPARVPPRCDTPPVTTSSASPTRTRPTAQDERKLKEILQRFKDDWDALERELRKFIEELKQGDRHDFPNLDPDVQVPFVHLVLEECGKGRDLTPAIYGGYTAEDAAGIKFVESRRV
jgi:hypothetical protein